MIIIPFIASFLYNYFNAYDDDYEFDDDYCNYCDYYDEPDGSGGSPEDNLTE